MVLTGLIAIIRGDRPSTAYYVELSTTAIRKKTHLFKKNFVIRGDDLII